MSCYMTWYMHGVIGICDENSSQTFHSTFIIYLLHVVVKEYLSGLWRVFRHDWQMNKMLAALLFSAVVFVICYGMTWVLRKVPGVKKVLSRGYEKFFCKLWKRKVFL